MIMLPAGYDATASCKLGAAMTMRLAMVNNMGGTELIRRKLGKDACLLLPCSARAR